MTGHKKFFGSISEHQEAGETHSAFADVLRKFEPSVSGVRINVSPKSPGGRGDRTLLLVDLCMSMKSNRPKNNVRTPDAYFIWLDAALDHHREVRSFVWKQEARAANTIFSTKFGASYDCANFQGCRPEEADDKVALRFLFQAKSTWAANQAAQDLCSQLAREDVVTGRPDAAAESIYLWLMSSSAGGSRSELRLRNLKVVDGWCELASPAVEMQLTQDRNQNPEYKSELEDRAEELRTAFVAVLRKTALRVFRATNNRQGSGYDSSDMSVEFISAERVLALYYGGGRTVK